MTTAQQLTAARKLANTFKEGTAEFNAACDEVRRLVDIQNSGSDFSSMNVILLPSHGRKAYRTIAA